MDAIEVPTMDEDPEAEYQDAFMAEFARPDEFGDGGNGKVVTEELPPVTVEAEEGANKSLRAVRYWRAEARKVAFQAQTEVDRIKAWEERELARLDRRIAWHEEGLRAFLWGTGKKTLKLAFGTLKRTAGRDRVVVEDAPAFLQAAGPDLVRVKTDPDKAAILRHIKATGEIPEGCDLVQGEDTFKATTD